MIAVAAALFVAGPPRGMLALELELIQVSGEAVGLAILEPAGLVALIRPLPSMPW